jgi:prepilin-type N-terminal cleavage/methylation domain-containing protein
MFSVVRSARGFSFTELMMVIAVAGTLMVIGVPILNDLSEGTKLNGAAREVERELQSARLKAVTVNRLLRVRLNCPAGGYFRTVEVLNNSTDLASNRCLMTAFPFPAPDTDIMTRPNHDGPMRILPVNTTVTGQIVEFRPDGTAVEIVANLAQEIATPLTITVTRYGKSKTVTVNGAGKIQLVQ